MKHDMHYEVMDLMEILTNSKIILLVMVNYIFFGKNLYITKINCLLS